MKNVMTLAVLMSLVAGGAMAEVNQDLLYKREKIINSRYTSELKNAKTGTAKQAVIKQYSTQMYPNGQMDYSKLPPEQRIKFGSAGVNAATENKDSGSSSWAQSRKKLQQQNGYSATLNYYDTSATTQGDAPSQMQLLPPR